MVAYSCLNYTVGVTLPDGLPLIPQTGEVHFKTELSGIKPEDKPTCTDAMTPSLSPATVISSRLTEGGGTLMRTLYFSTNSFLMRFQGPQTNGW